jgi:AcrR family transcriptional regulator
MTKKPPSHLSDSDRMNFLNALCGGESVSKAAKAAGVARSTLYYWKGEDEAFSDAWDDALTQGTHALIDEVKDRAFDRKDRFSHILLMFLLKQRDPSFREAYKTEGKLTVEHVKEFDFTSKEIDQAVEILQAARGDKPSLAPD